jgi:hypothetical protein
MWKIDLIDFVAGFDHHIALGKGGGREMRNHALEMIARKGGEEFVVQGVTGR